VGSTEVVTKPPEIPSKWDIIPIHSSDIANFKRCRRYWDWTSPTRTNLRRKVSIYGINFPLAFGSAIHYALEKFYDPILSHDPVESFLTYWTYQWEGGVVTEDWLDRVYDIHPRVTPRNRHIDKEGTPRLFEIKGLRDLLPAPEQIEDEWQLHRELGIGMMEFYKSYAEKNDDFIVLAAESTYSIPLEFDWKDQRLESPNYGKRLQVHARGKRDAVVWWPEIDKCGIYEDKTAARIDDAYFEKLNKDEQCSNYLWATIQEAAIYDLPWKDKVVDRVIYNAMRKNFPKLPTITKHGFPSINRAEEGTTADLFQALIVGNENYDHWFRTNEKAQQYYTYLVEQGDSLFVQRDIVTRNKYEIAATGRHLKMIALEMLDMPRVYPNPTGEYRCLTCAFRTPCIAADDGSDWQGILSDGYEANRDR